MSRKDIDIFLWGVDEQIFIISKQRAWPIKRSSIKTWDSQCCAYVPKGEKRFCLTIYENVPLVPRKKARYSLGISIKHALMNILSHSAFHRDRTSLFLLFDTYDVANRISRCILNVYSSLNIFCDTCCNKLNVFLFFQLFVEILSFDIQYLLAVDISREDYRSQWQRHINEYINSWQIN